MADKLKYRAFISYSHRDKKWGDWLHKALETYRVPRRVAGTPGRDGPVPKRLFPIFRDREELPASADLSDQITAALQQSACLVVICSPNSAKSIWVNEEILAYKRIGREDRILAMIVDGEPNASDKPHVDPALECFPPGLKFRADPDGRLSEVRVEPIAADARPGRDGKDNAKLKVIAGILGVSFDALRRRDERRRAIRRMAATSVVAAALGAVALYSWQVYDRGELIAESEPVNSTIAVDGVELGARIRNLPLRTGRHELVAWAPDHFELRRSIEVPRGQAVTTRFWLEHGFDWKPYVSPSIQGGLVLIPGEDDTILAHNELTRIIFMSTATGSIVSSIATPEGNARTFLELDLGGDVGKVIVSALDAEGGGPEVLVIRASATPKVMWRWSGPASDQSRSSSVAVAAFPGRSGVAALAVAGRDGRVTFLDGRSGEKIGEVRIASTPLPHAPVLVAAADGEASRLVVFYRQADGVPGDSARPRRLAAVSITAPAGDEIDWRRDYGTSWEGPSLAFAIDGAPHVVLWNDARWRVIDLATGSERSGGALPGRPFGGPAVADLEGGGTSDLVFQFVDPSLAMLAVRAADGATVWRGPNNLSAGYQPRGPGGTMLRTSGGALLVYLEDALAAVDARDGRVAWELAGRPTGALIGDWNGDGKDEILVTMAGAGLLCLDGDGRVLWTLRVEDRDVRPWALVKSKFGGAIRDILVHRHAGLIGLVHGPRVLWKTTAAAAIQATPVVARAENGDAVIVEIANWGGDVHLRAFSGVGGGTRWSAKEAFTPNRGAALADLDGNGTRLVVALGRRPPAEGIFLLAYRPSDGRLARAVPLAVRGWFSSTPVVADFRGIGKRDVAFSTWDERAIVMADATSGKILWRHKTDAPNMGGVSAGDLDGDGLADVVAASFDGHVYGLRGKDGRLLWKSPIDGGGWSKPVVAQLDDGGAGHVLVVSTKGRLYVFAAATGEIAWSPDIAGGRKVAGHPAVVRKAGRTILLAPLGDAGVVAFDWARRAELWRSPPGFPVIASPVVSDLGSENGSVLVATVTGEVWLLNLTDGRPIWRKRIVDGAIEADPVVADLDGDGIDDILIAGHDRKLHALNGAGSIGARR